MIDAYKIGISLWLTGDPEKKLDKFIASLEAANVKLKTLKTSLATTNEQLTTLLNAAAAATTPLVELSSTLKGFRADIAPITGITTSINQMNAAFSRSVLAAQKATASFAAFNDVGTATASAGAFSASEMATAYAAAGGGGRRNNENKGSRSGKKGMPFGVHERMHMGAFYASIPGGMAGLGAIGGGYLLYKGFEQNSNFQQATAQLQMQGFTGAQVGEAVNIANNANLPGISSTMMMSAINDAAMSTRNFGMAKYLAPVLAEVAFANQATGRDFSGADENNLIRFAEMRGGSDPAAIAREINLGEQFYTGTGGRVGPSDLVAFLKRAGVAAYHISDTGMYGLEPSIQEMRGTTVGTALRTGYNQLIGGKGMSQIEGINLTNLGLLNPSRKIYNPNTGKYITKFGTLKDQYATQFQTDPSGFAETIVNILKQHGITDPKKITAAIATDFASTYGSYIENVDKNRQKIDRAKQMNAKAYTGIEAYQYGLNLPKGKVLALDAAMADFGKALGELTSPAIIGGLDLLTGFFKNLTTTIKVLEHPLATIRGAAGLDPNNSPNVLKPGTNNPWQVTVVQQMDSKTIGGVVVDGLTKTVTRMPTGPTQFNPLSVLMPTTMSTPFSIGGYS